MSRTVEDLLAEARSRIERLEPRVAAAAAGAGGVIVDLRCTDDRQAEGAIPGALAVPRSVLEWRADPSSEHRDERIASFERHLILVCNDGFSSSLAAANLRELGFEHVSDIVGGFRAWKAEGLPVDPVH